jgi:prepilin-type processing-associated H-X9-DG protein
VLELDDEVPHFEAHVRQEHLVQLPDAGPAYDGSQFQFTTRVGGPGVGIASGPSDDAGGAGWMAFGSWHPAGCQIAYADGRVGRLSSDIGSDLLARLCNRADGRNQVASR